MSLPDSILERVLYLQNAIVSLATGGELDEPGYSTIRSEVMFDPALKDLAPQYVRTCRTGEALREHLKGVASGSGSYSVRRGYIFESFHPLLDHLEGRHSAPVDMQAEEVLSSFDIESVHAVWTKALERRKSDPDGAITAAKTLVESVCKRILDEEGQHYGPSDSLPKLYGLASKTLNAAPSQHSVEVFRNILSGCHTVVQNLGELRNKLGDAHGQGRSPARPAPRHAALAVNLAGAMATFLVETWNYQKGRGDGH